MPTPTPATTIPASKKAADFMSVTDRPGEYEACEGRSRYCTSITTFYTADGVPCCEPCAEHQGFKALGMEV